MNSGVFGLHFGMLWGGVKVGFGDLWRNLGAQTPIGTGSENCMPKRCLGDSANILIYNHLMFPRESLRGETAVESGRTAGS